MIIRKLTLEGEEVGYRVYMCDKSYDMFPNDAMSFMNLVGRDNFILGSDIPMRIKDNTCVSDNESSVEECNDWFSLAQECLKQNL